MFDMNESLHEKLIQTIGPMREITLLEEQGWTSKVRRITTNERSFLLKSSYIERYRTWLKCEAKILRLLKQNDAIPVPEYFGFFEEEKNSHLLMSFEEGISLTKALKRAKSDSEEKALLQSFGLFLQQFHEHDSLLTFEPNGDWLDKQLTRAQEDFEKGQTDGNVSLELLKELKNHRPKAVPKTMIHGDCTMDNVFVINDKVELFIDVGAMTVGDPRYDEALAIRKFKNRPEHLVAFYEGYKRYRVTPEELQYFEGLYEFF